MPNGSGRDGRLPKETVGSDRPSLEQRTDHRKNWRRRASGPEVTVNSRLYLSSRPKLLSNWYRMPCCRPARRAALRNVIRIRPEQGERGVSTTSVVISFLAVLIVAHFVRAIRSW